MNDNEQLTLDGIPGPASPKPADTDVLAALIEFAEAHGVPALPEATFADRLRALARKMEAEAEEEDKCPPGIFDDAAQVIIDEIREGGDPWVA